MIFIIAYNEIKFYYFLPHSHTHTHGSTHGSTHGDDADGIKSEFCEN